MNHKLLKVTGLIGIGVVIGAVINAFNKPDITPGEPVVSEQHPVSSKFSPFSRDNSSKDKLSNLEDTVQSLQRQLELEIRKREQLQHKISLLEKNFTNTEDVSHKDDDSENLLVTDNDAAPQQTDMPRQNSSWFNEQALLDAGVDQSKVSYIKGVFEQAEMDKLYLRDQATREGWIGSERYNTAAKEIADRASAIKSQLSDDEYDAYLYASGRTNRVIVESVLSNSPASYAGIQAGDVILSYDNQRIYNWTDLTGATSKGTANTTVAVTIVRNDQQQQVYVPRGPLGVRLTTDSAAP